jgi:toxin ParE1/3/4
LSRRLEVTNAARRDLLAIGDFTFERWGEDQCVRYLRQLDARMRALVKDEKLGRLCGPSLPGYWRCPEGRHVIFFRRDGRRVIVVRVLHERMLPERHLE